MTGYVYPLLDLFWSMLFAFLFVMWIWLLVVVLSDIFRSPDMRGLGKGMWFLFVLLIPLVGVLVYLIARGHKMQEHAVQRAKQQDEAFRKYVREATDGESSTPDQLSKLANMRDRQVITSEEFEREKAKLLA